MTIIEIKAKKIMACPGSWAWAAEALVNIGDGNEVFVTVNYYDTEVYSVSKQSVYAYLAEDGDEPVDELSEEYDNYKEAKQSEYAEVFGQLRKVIKMLG